MVGTACSSEALFRPPSMVVRLAAFRSRQPLLEYIAFVHQCALFSCCISSSSSKQVSALSAFIDDC